MYRYDEMKPSLLTDNGQRMLFNVRDFVHQTLKTAGAVRMQEAMDAACDGWGEWERLAAVDRLVELGEIREIPQEGVPGQHRIFVKGGE